MPSSAHLVDEAVGWKASRCPRCPNNEMHLMIPKVARHDGNLFFGCVHFPTCRGTLPWKAFTSRARSSAETEAGRASASARELNESDSDLQEPWPSALERGAYSDEPEEEEEKEVKPSVAERRAKFEKPKLAAKAKLKPKPKPTRIPVEVTENYVIGSDAEMVFRFDENDDWSRPAS
jgi:ssDNA-binding Zn-finger/Zn-ribbon topoisomerase 1